MDLHNNGDGRSCDHDFRWPDQDQSLWIGRKFFWTFLLYILHSAVKRIGRRSRVFLLKLLSQHFRTGSLGVFILIVSAEHVIGDAGV